MRRDTSPDRSRGLDIAIIGMAGRFPGVRNVDEFWRNLRDGVESIHLFSDAELVALGVSPELIRNPRYVKAAAILEDFECFDAALFGISPAEAEIMDPQHRVFLECVWEALETAGYDAEQYDGLIGLFGGARLNGYIANIYGAARGVTDLQILLSNDKDHLTTRVSYKLGLEGPSMAVQSACSTSLVAVHLACQSLLSGESDLALAGGVAVKVPQRAGYLHTPGEIFSPDGHTRTFDGRGQGTLFGSGVGIVVLKRLAEAKEDGDHIRAVIRGSAVNNDGAQRLGYAAPRPDGQAKVIAAALGVSGVEPTTITYVEAHGTATPLGDPIEIAALRQAFAGVRPGSCAVGSVKTNVGHLETAAGVAGLIKTVLALEHGQIPPSLHFEQPNPAIDFASSPFYVNARLAEWKTDGGPRRAGVSSFGMGGTNAHLVLEEAPAAVVAGPSRPWHLLLLSARTAAALERMTTNLAEHLERHPELDLADVAHTLHLGRRALSHRRILVSRDVGDAAAALRQLDPKRVASGVEESRDRPVSFLFPGQGAQHVGMARTLYAHEAVFRREVDRCASLLEPYLRLDLRTLLDPPADRRAAVEERLARTEMVQPVLFTVELALARLWMSWGVRPESLIGHSIGEYVAACLAGTFRLEDALALVALRGRLMQRLPPGAMLSVPLDEREFGELMDSDLSLAAVNAPCLCVISGPLESIDRLHGRLRTKGLECRRLRTSHAFHSAMMEPILEQFAAEVARLPLSPPRIPFLSNLTGDWITAADATDPLYWVRHLRQTVRFSDGLARLLAEPERVLLEVGPGRSLSSLARRQPGWPAGGVALASLPNPDEPQSDLAFLLGTLGRLWLSGLQIDGKGLYAGQRRRRVLLPSYPFERQRYWIEGRPVAAAAQPAPPPGRTADLTDWFYLPVWKQSLPPVPPPRGGTERGSRWLIFGDHRGLGAAIAARLRQEGHQVITVTTGEGFRHLADDSCALAPGCRAHYDALLKEYGVPEEILHLWSVTGHGSAEEPTDLRARGLYSLLFLAQALGERDVRRPLRLRIVTDGLWAVGSEEVPCAEKATLLGPVRGIPQEYPHISCRAIDVVLPRPDAPLEPLVARLFAELAADLQGISVAYRGPQRWLRTFEAVRLEERTDLAGKLRPGGVYLITGGLGGIGLTLAERLARDVQARLVLTSRTGLPAREEWSAWLRERGEGDAMSRKIRRIEAIERVGGEVLALAADAADEDQMRAAVQQARERFGRIHGAIHSAGVPGGGLIQLKTPEAVEAVLASKVRGARILAALLEEEPVDFLVLLSSAISLTGGVGQVDYCAANAFLDAFAHERNARGHLTLAINWDVWRDLGMAAAALAAPAARSVRGRPQDNGAGVAPVHPLLGHRVGGGEDEDIYLAELSPAGHWLLAEHRLLGEPVLPGVAFLEIAWAALRQRATGAAAWIRDLVLLEPLHVPEGGTRHVKTVLRRTEEGFSLTVRSRPAPGDDGAGGWQEHAACALGVLEDGPAHHDLEDLLACRPPVGEASGGSALPPEGPVSWGPRWQEIRTSYLGDGLALLELRDAGVLDGAGFALYPPLLDLATACGPLLLGDGPYLPFGYKRLRLVQRLPARIYVRFRPRERAPAQGETVEFDFTLLDETGRELVTIEELTLRRLRPAARPWVDSAGRARSVPAGDGAMDLLAQSIAPEEGAEAFSRALAQLTVPQIVISARTANIVLDHLARGTAPAPPSASRESTPLPAQHRRPPLQTPYVAPRNEIERTITELWQQALGFETIGVHDDFFDLGGDSILSLRLLIRLRETFELELPLNSLFEKPTVAELAALVLRSFSEGLGTEDLNQTLAELEWLSDEEVRALVETDREEHLDV